MTSISRAFACLLAVGLSFTALAEAGAEKVVPNPVYAAWAKVPDGTLVKWTSQRVNIMEPAKTVGPFTVRITKDEVVLTDTNANMDLKIPAFIPESALPKDEPTDKKSERKLKDGTVITCKLVLRKEAGQPDAKVWLSDDVPGGVVERECEHPKRGGTLVEKLAGYKMPNKEWAEFQVPAPDPNSAHPIDLPPPAVPEKQPEEKPKDTK